MSTAKQCDQAAVVVDEKQSSQSEDSTTKELQQDSKTHDDEEQPTSTAEVDREQMEEETATAVNAGPSESSTTSEPDALGVAHTFLNSGKRHLACDDYPQAVEALAEASELLADKFGDMANETVEAYFYYGKALLELARMENGVLGNALDGVAAEEENEANLSESDQFEKASTLPEGERETLVTQVYSAMSAEEKADEGKGTNEEVDKSNGAADGNENDDNAEGTGDKDTKQESAEGEDGGDSSAEGEDSAEEEADNVEDTATGSSQEEMEDAEDVPNLQLAWEVLEIAKKIYLKQKESEDCDKSVKVKLSEVYLVLGEVSLEAGSYDQSILDMTLCLELQTECMDPDNRCIAETHYQLGNAHLFNKNYPKAVEELKKAQTIIETRISNLKSCTEEEGAEKREKECNELQELLPDIVAKVEDVEDESRNAQKAESEVKAIITSQQGAGNTTIGFGDASTANGASTIATTIPTKKANDISNLVRKRKPEDQGEEEVKKVKPDVVNGAVNKENGSVHVSAGDS